MPLYTLVNPTKAAISAPYGTFASFTVTPNVELTNAQLRNAIRVRGAVCLNEGVTDKDRARTAFCLLVGLVAGIATPAQRELFVLKEGQEEYENLLDALRSID